MSDANINAMSFSQLKNEVQRLRDELAIMQRKYEDILYNLDDNNFSSRFVEEKENMKTAISVTAEGIESKVSKEDFESQMMQTAEAIKTKVSKEDFESQMEQTAESISSIVSKNISAYFTKASKPTASNTTQAQKAMLCLYDDVYYYYSDIKDEWLEYPASGLKTMFKQSGTGFNLTGDVKISGDLITEGTISADRISTDIAQVNGNLHIGDKDANERKSIIFNNNATIGCTEDGIGSYYGIVINANLLRLSGCANVNGNWNFSNATVTLPDDTTVPAVFA